MNKLILTFDYELFGDGSGNVFTHIIEPTNKILDICNKHNIKTTVFFEVLEYMKLKEEWDKGNTMGYSVNPIEAIEKQIQHAALLGHDIQLHIHPQWHNAKYVNDKWVLDFSNWRLGDFQSKLNYGIYELIENSKAMIEALIKPVLPNYRCIGLRAGGYNIMPSKSVYAAMKSLNMKYDSSVYPGGYEVGSLSKYDYRKVPSCLDHWWANSNDIRMSSDVEKEVLEIPIFALPFPRWQRLLTVAKLKSIVFRHKNAISSVTQEKVGKNRFLDKIRFLKETEASTWDVCMFPKFLHKKFFNHIEKSLAGERDSYVLIGHPKSLQDENNFESFIKIANSRSYKYVFKTLTEMYEESVI